MGVVGVVVVVRLWALGRGGLADFGAGRNFLGGLFFGMHVYRFLFFVLHFKSKNGPFVMVFVGAMLVASIATTFAGVITPPGRNLTTWNYHCGPRYRFKQGDEVGLFQYGSTVILISSDEWALNSDIHDGQQTLYGQSVGQMKHKA